MVLIFVTWTNYTATVNGRVLKLVPCENCSTEYVYVLDREATGVGTSVYGLNDEGAQGNAASSADAALRDYLANDFDPVPCPACGHYQRYMFPKLLDTRSPWVLIATLAVLAVGGLSAVSAAYWGVSYLEQPSERALWRLAAACSALAFAGVIGAGMSVAHRVRVRRFDPNTEDQRARVERGRGRAVTRAEFEAGQQPGDRPGRTDGTDRPAEPPLHPVSYTHLTLPTTERV